MLISRMFPETRVQRVFLLWPPSEGPSGGRSQGELQTLQLLLWIIANENLRNPQKQARCRGTLHDDRKELATERKGST